MESELAQLLLVEVTIYPIVLGILSPLMRVLHWWLSPFRCEWNVPVRYAGRFLIRLRAVPFEVLCFGHAPRARRLAARWQELTAEAPIWHTQQVGARPTFLAVAGPDPQLARAFAVELICSGIFWRRLRRDHVLFVISNHHVEAYTGLSGRADASLAKKAAAVVLPETQRRLAPDDTEFAAARSITIERGDYRLSVGGRLASSEACQLAREIANRGLWKFRANTRIRLARSAVEIHTDGNVATAELAAFVEGFCRYVVLADLHLGVAGRDTFGPAKAAALVRVLDEVARRRSVLVLNGDFLELLHEPYAKIRASYAEVFKSLARVRRVIYVVGNHDSEILDHGSQPHPFVREFGVQPVKYHWDAARGLYFEHGHFAVPSCDGSRFGRSLARAAGRLKRFGFKQIEHWCEDYLGGKVQDVYPFVEVHNRRMLVERHVAVATALSSVGPQPPSIFCSHTHEPARAEANPVHYFIKETTGGDFAATGAWTSRRRLRRQGQTRVDWLEVDATNRIRVRRLDLDRPATFTWLETASEATRSAAPSAHA